MGKIGPTKAPILEVETLDGPEGSLSPGGILAAKVGQRLGRGGAWPAAPFHERPANGARSEALWRRRSGGRSFLRWQRGATGWADRSRRWSAILARLRGAPGATRR